MPAEVRSKTKIALEAPAAAGSGSERLPDPCVLVIFGASGDLTHRKLIPALYSLEYRGHALVYQALVDPSK